MDNLIYVYCISNKPHVPLGDFAAKEIKSLKFDDFYAIVKHVSESEFSEDNFKNNLSDYKWLESNAREHISVINTIMESCSVVPFRFGTIYKTEEGLKKFISDYSGSLTDNFNYINGKEEWAVKVYCDRKTLGEQIDEFSVDAAALEKQIMESSPGKAFLLKRKKTELIETELDRVCKTFGQEYFDELKNLSESSGLNNLLPKELTGREDTMILNASFLVSKIIMTDFKSMIEILRLKSDPSGFFIEVSGPWPPFSFISIKE